MVPVVDPIALAAVLIAVSVWLAMPRATALLQRLTTPAQRGVPQLPILTPVEGAAAPPQRRQAAITGAGVAGLVALAVGANWWIPVAAGAGAVLAYAASGRITTRAHRQRTARLVADLPGAVEMLASCLRAGQPLRNGAQAVATAYDGPVAEDLEAILTRIRIGDSESRVWAAWRGHPQWGPVARDLARSVDSGTALVDTLLVHAERARAAHHADQVTRARSLGVRSVLPMVVCFLPAFMLVGVVPIVVGSVTALW